MTRELTCINCPMGCTLSVEMEDGKVISVTGNGCPIGERYGREEVVAPKRVLTSSVVIKGAKEKVVSVRTTSPIDKGSLKEAMELINSIEVSAPVRIGDVVIRDIFNSGADVIITKNVDAAH
ncbi:MAG: DUF1667 domain-containing protein [Erysipelotrichaceae bacterium]|nr:DUF1667 domain-containing protein [Erysipelotrichaceae bacterium]